MKDSLYILDKMATFGFQLGEVRLQLKQTSYLAVDQLRILRKRRTNLIQKIKYWSKQLAEHEKENST